MVRILTETKYRVTEENITASTNQTQGQQPLTVDNNIISTVANDNDTVTLIAVDVGIFQRVINNGDNILQIFPALGNDLGNGVNNPLTLPSNDQISFLGINETTWKNLAVQGISIGGADLDFGGFNLSGLGILSFDDANTSIQQATADLQFDVITSGAFDLRINDITEYLFNATEADWKLNDIVNLRLLSFADSDVKITSASGNMILDVPTAKLVDVLVNNIGEYSFSAEQANFFGNNLVNVGYFESDAATPAGAGQIRFGNTEEIRWRNPANDDDMILQGDNLNFISISNCRGLNLENDDFVRWDGDDKRRIANDGIGFIFAVDTGDRFDYKINEIDEYIYNTTEADFLGNNLVNVGFFESDAGNASTVGNIRLGNNEQIGWRDAANTFDALLTYDSIDHFNFKTTNKRVILELEADHTTPANGNEVGAIEFVDDNSDGSRKAYAQIGVSIEVPTAGAERAEMFFHMTDGTGIFDPYMIFNDENDGAITMEHAVQIEDTIDYKKITEPADPPIEEGRLYVKQINGNTNGLFVKIKQANSITEVQIS